MKEKERIQEKGITLIALVITIIVLLILAGVAINALLGENGVLKKSTDAKIETSHGEIKENIILGVNEWFADRNDPAKSGVNPNVIEYLKEKGYINEVSGEEYYRVPDKGNLGKGKTKTEGDIYVIEKDDTATGNTTKVATIGISDIKKVAVETTEEWYWLRYYETSSKSRDLLKISTKGRLIYCDSKNDNNNDDNNDDDSEDEAKIGEETPRISEDDTDIKLGEKRSIQYIEDLVQLAINVDNGISYEGVTIGLTKNLDFNTEDSYEHPDENKFNKDYNGNEEIEGLKTELTNVTAMDSESVQIGISEDKPFKGTFTGQNNMLSNIYVANKKDNSEKTVEGLFGYNSGTIKNCNINNVTLMAGTYDKPIGLIIGQNDGTLSDISFTGNYVSRYAPPKSLSLMVNKNNGTVQNCKVDFSSSTAAPQTAIGAGIVVENNGKVKGCENYTLFTDYSIEVMGGIIAKNNSAEPIEDCINGREENSQMSSQLMPYGQFLAGIVGCNNSNTLIIKGCTNYFNLNNTSGPTAGIVVNANQDAEITIQECTNYGNMQKGYGHPSGILNSTESSSTNNNISAKEIIISNCDNYGAFGSSTYAAGITTTYGEEKFEITGCNNYGNIIVSGGYGSGGIAKESVTGTISNCNNYGNISSTTSGEFGGIIYKAVNTQISECNNGKENCTEEFITTSGGSSGGIVGDISSSSIKNCNNYINIDFKQTSKCGGIAGIINDVTIENCTNYGNLNISNSYMGGIVGRANSTKSNIITSCTNNGELTGKGYVGGIIGDTGAENTITLCSNKKIIKGTSLLGGIIGNLQGYDHTTTLTKCYNLADIIGEGTSADHIGGIIGNFISNGNIINCYNNSSISGNNYIGGIIGEMPNNSNGVCNNCYNLGDVSGKNDVGGIAGHGFYGKNCYNAGKVTGTSNVGQFTGYLQPNYATNCYTKVEDNERSVGYYFGPSVSDSEVTSKSLGEMKSEDFKNTLNQNKGENENWSNWLWNEGENNGLPYLEGVPLE